MRRYSAFPLWQMISGYCQLTVCTVAFQSIYTWSMSRALSKVMCSVKRHVLRQTSRDTTATADQLQYFTYLPISVTCTYTQLVQSCSNVNRQTPHHYTNTVKRHVTFRDFYSSVTWHFFISTVLFRRHMHLSALSTQLVHSCSNVTCTSWLHFFATFPRYIPSPYLRYLRYLRYLLYTSSSVQTSTPHRRISSPHSLATFHRFALECKLGNVCSETLCSSVRLQ